MRKLVVTVVVVAVVAAGVVVFREVGAWLSADDPLRPVDVLVVPAGDPDHRLPAALGHLEAGRAEEVWMTVSPQGPVLRERPAIQRFVEDRGVSEQVRVVGRTRTHRGTAAIVARRLDRFRPEGEVSLGVVTSPWSTTRDRITFQRTLGPRAEVVVWPDGQRYSADRWWVRDAPRTGIEAAKLLGTLALFGAQPLGVDEDVPPGLALRALAVGFIVALVAGAACRPVARRLRLVARPRLFRAHAYPVPLLGGLAILAGLAGGVLGAGGLAIGAVGAVAVGGVITLALVGLVDDLVGLGARSRIVWAALAGGSAWLLGLRVHVFPPGVAGDVGDALLTVIWFVGITHAVNLLDNTDGAAAGVGAVSSAAIGGVALAGGQWVVAVGAFALAGACLGYLVHNVHPARLFMGDLGALGVGFALAALALALRPEVGEPLSFVVGMFALGVPIFDTVLVTTSRLRSGRPVSSGGTDHPAHRLIARGFSVRTSAALLWGAQALLGGAAYAVAVSSGGPWAWVLTGLVSAVGLGGLIWFLRLPPWRPPYRERPVRGVVDAIERAVGPLRELVRTGRANGLASSDRETMRSAEDALERLEQARRRLDQEA